jgi:hypothetical protein
MVVGDGRNGAIPHFQVFYYLCDFLTGNQTFGFLPDFGDATLDIIPSDHVAQAICYSACQGADLGCVLHLCAGSAPELRLQRLAPIVCSIYESAGRACAPHRQLSQAVFRRATDAAAWLGRGRLRKSARALKYFLPYLAAAQQFSTIATSQLLKNRAMAALRAEDYLPRVLAPYLCQAKPAIPRRGPLSLT